MNILIAGDLAPIRRYEKELSKGNLSFIDEPILKEVHESDFFLVNLESPLSEHKPISKSALPTLVANPQVVKGLKALRVDACCLGNNHILDAGVNGLESTTATLNQYGIDFFGVGLNSKESNQLYIKEIESKKIGFYSISNNEFSIATDTTAGANPEDVVNWFYDIQKFKKQVDFLIILYHTGIEGSIYPAPNLQKKCKLLIDLGADFITCQHSHVVGTFEKYKDKNIFYGQGDFIFDYGVDIKDYRKFGSLLKLDINNNSIEVKILYFKRSGIEIKVLMEDEEKEFLSEIANSSNNLSNVDYLNEYYENVVKERDAHYFNIFFSFGNLFLLKVLNKMNVTKNFYSKSFCKILLNIIQNEIHRNILIKILRKRL